MGFSNADVKDGQLFGYSQIIQLAVQYMQLGLATQLRLRISHCSTMRFQSILLISLISIKSYQVYRKLLSCISQKGTQDFMSDPSDVATTQWQRLDVLFTITS